MRRQVAPIRADYFESQYCFTPSGSVTNSLAESIAKEAFADYSPAGLTSYLTFRYPVLANTMFDGYRALQCGTEVVHGEEHAYWRPKFREQPVPLHEAIDAVEALLLEALDSLIRGKQEIGFTLSGGLDSSLLVAMVHRHFPTKTLHTYSCGFYGDDEFEYSREVAKLSASQHREVVLDKSDFLSETSILKPLIQHKGAPLHPNELPLATLEGLAKRDGCDIVLNGEGADDLFGGYGRNLRMYLNYSGSDADYFRHILREYRYFSLVERRRLVRPEWLVDDCDLVASVFSEHDCPEDPQDQMFYFIQRLHTPGLIGRAWNALRFNNIAGGFPFVFPKLVDYANSLPFNYKVHWNEGVDTATMGSLDYRDVSEKFDCPKYVLKKVAEKYLPTQIVYRRKYGFPVPFDSWFSASSEFHLNRHIFATEDIGWLSGWKKFMVLNLNAFFEVFDPWRR